MTVRRHSRGTLVHLAIVLVVLMGAAACGVSSPAVDTATWHQEAHGVRWRALRPSSGDAGFVEHASDATGLAHRNDVSDEHALANRNLLIGAGVALGDLDEDGLPDMFLASVERPAALYHNDGGFRFHDVTDSSGISTAGLATLSATFADVDGDRHLDLLVGTLGGPLRLWMGDGHGRFRDASPALGDAATGHWAATSLTLADVDGDGDLDLYVGTYKTRNALDAYPPLDRTFEQVVRKTGGQYRVEPRWAQEYRVEDRPDLGGVMRSQRAEPDLFLVNDGAGHFTREPVAGPRFRDADGRPVAQEPDFFTLAARFYDVNGDGAPDLYVCNDFEDPDQFWLGDGKGGFRLAPALALRQTSNTCMSVDFADVNRDGHVDFFTADMASPALARRQTQLPTNTPLPKRVGLDTTRQQWMRNALQVGRGDGTWAEVAMYAGIDASEWTWGSAFTDVDLDGWDDLLVVNGHRWDVRDADTFQRIRDAFPKVAWNREQGEFPRHDAHSMAFRNAGSDSDAVGAPRFANAGDAWHFGGTASITNGIALADLDGDGDMDVVTTRLDDTPLVYEATSGAPRVAIRLRGAARNVTGIGATVTVRGAATGTQARQMMPTGYYLSGSDAQLTFASGSDSVVQVEVRWPGGRVSHTSARPSCLYEIDESGATSPDARTLSAGGDSSGSALFEDVTTLLGGHVHVDSAYDDYRRQPLLPNKFSQLGPGVSWIDVDRDGREDLVVGTGRGGRIGVLRNEGTRFAAIPVVGPAERWDVTTLLPMPLGDGLALVYGQSSWEADSASQALSVAPVVMRALTRNSVLAPPSGAIARADSSSVGPLAMADVDGDGQLELFVGARAVPGAWPLPARSRLYHRTPDGGWAVDTTNARVLGALGLVSAALFTDLDGDGRPELVVTSEFGPVRVLHNEGGGRLRDATREWGLSTTTSRWNALAAGDFDGDGRMDLVVTSWGRNGPWRASPDNPYELVLGDFGGAGLGLVFARRDSVAATTAAPWWRAAFGGAAPRASLGAERPLESFARLGIAIPAVRTRFATYGEYAHATVDDVLGEQASRAVRIGATTFENLVLYNRGGRFEARALEAPASLAPAFGVVVADFDGDGREDVFLAQNFSATAIETPRLDAGVGVLLLGSRSGRFVATSPNRSGIRVPGDGRGAAVADYDADGRPDLAVGENGARTTLWHNRGARPGLRVRLDGPPGNPWGIGAQLRVVAAGQRGPARELHAGSGYWSMDAATTVLALPAGADSLVVRWPGGREQVVPLAPGQREVTVRAQ